MNWNMALPLAADIVTAFPPVNLATGANNGLWLNMKDVEAVNVLVWSAAGGTASEDPVISLRQALTSAGGSAKTLQLKRCWYKIGSGAIAQSGATDLWTKVSSIVEFESPANSWSSASIDGAENELWFCAHVLATDLDRANGFDYLQVQVADVGSGAQLGAAFYIPAPYYQGIQSVSRLA